MWSFTVILPLISWFVYISIQVGVTMGHSEPAPPPHRQVAMTRNVLLMQFTKSMSCDES